MKGAPPPAGNGAARPTAPPAEQRPPAGPAPGGTVRWGIVKAATGRAPRYAGRPRGRRPREIPPAAPRTPLPQSTVRPTSGAAARAAWQAVGASRQRSDTPATRLP